MDNLESANIEDPFIAPLDLDLKKQISQISFTHLEGKKLQDMFGGDEMAGYQDPSNADYWQDTLFDPEGMMDANLEDQLLSEFMKLTEKQAKKLSKNLSVMKSDQVQFNYEYWIDPKQSNQEEGQQQPIIYMTGQFNDWDLEPMNIDIATNQDSNPDHQGKLKFTYSKQVNGGQIYNFYLIVNGVMTVDENQKKSQNEKSNWIFVPLSEKNKQKAQDFFSKPISLRMLKLKRIAMALDYLSRKQFRTADEQRDLKLKSLQYNKMLITVTQDLNDRYVTENLSEMAMTNMMVAQQGPKPVIHQIIDFKITHDKAFIKIQSVLDKNEILLDKKKQYNVFEIPIERFLSNYNIMPMAEEIKLRQEINQTKKYFMFVRYFAEEEDGYSLLEVKPQGLPIHEYDINYHEGTKKILHISNRDLRTEVRFHDMNQLDKTGYVHGSTVQIWTQIDQKDLAQETLNIFHIQVNDTSDYITFDVAYMHEGESLNQFMTFSKDLQGRPLKYKIIAKDSKVHTVLYNMNIAEKESTQAEQMLGNDQTKTGVKEIPFEEHSFQVGDYLYSSDKYNQASVQTKFVGQIVNIPTGYITSADFNKVQQYEPIKLEYPMKGHCSARHLDELPGYVDLELLGQQDDSKTILPITVQQSSKGLPYSRQAHVISSFIHATKDQLQSLEEKKKEVSESQQSDLKVEIKQFVEIVSEAETVLKNIHQNTAEKLDQEELKKFIQKIQQKLASLEEIFDGVEESDQIKDLAEEYEESTENLQQILGKLVRLSRF